jgi:molybdenum cofactor cytidylyltransferase
VNAPLAGVILSAGASSRMGSPKALLKAPGSAECFLDRLIGILAPHCNPVIVVLGHQAEAIRAGISRGAQTVLVVNDRYTLGQLSSLQCGLRAVPEDAAGVLFTPVDHPGVRPETIERIVAAFRGNAGAMLAIPRHQGQRGHPVCCARELIPEFLALPPGAQARDAIHRRLGDACYVEVDDPGVVNDIDDPETYRRLV